MADDPTRRNTLRMGLPGPAPEPTPKAPHPATITKPAPQRYVLLGDAPTRKKTPKPPEVDTSDDPGALYEELTPHLSWLAEERRPEIRRLLLRGELERILGHFQDEHTRYPRNVSVEKCQRIIERALVRRLTHKLDPTERIPVKTGELSSARPRDPRVLIADRVDGTSTVDEILRPLTLSRVVGLQAIESLLEQGVIAFKPREPSIIPSAPQPPRVSEAPAGLERDEVPVSSRVTLADPVEAEAQAARLRASPPADPEPAKPAEKPAEKPASVPPIPLASAKAVTDAPAFTAPAAAPTPSPFERVPVDGSVPPPDGGRRIVTGLVGITGAAVGIAVVAIIFATGETSPPPSVPGGAQAPAPSATVTTVPLTPAPPSASAPVAAAEPSTMTITMEVTPTYARVYLDKERIKPPYERTIPRDGADHELKIEAPGHKTKKIPFKATADLALVVALEALPKKKKNPTTNEDIY